MCPPAPVDITKFWTEEEIFKSLENLKSGSPIPANVTADVNPYQVEPSNLPEGIWYFCSEVNKKAQHGYWKATGEACDIYSNSAMTGWRATLKFYEGIAPHERRTNWVMQEYWITKRELCQNSKPKVFDSLCRVFMSDEESPAHELPPEHDLPDIFNTNPVNCVPTTAPNADTNTGQLSKSESLEKNMFKETRGLALAERSPCHHPLENLAEYILNEDYLELNDLADPDSDSSNSVNSSFRTFTSEEYFDSVALLQELDAENKDQNEKCASFKLTHSTAVKPKEVVMLPAIVGSLSSDNGSKSPTEGTHKGDYMNEGTSNSPNIVLVASSSSSSNGSLKEEKKGLVGRMKKLKSKYLCFMSL